MERTETERGAEGSKAAELSPTKREQIVGGARAVFHELGYERASVDAIAARAGVSKATVYNHFPGGKQALFMAPFDAETEDVRKKLLSLLEEPTGDIEADLRRIGEQLLRLIGSPSQVQRFRVVIGAAERFPELGKALYECIISAGHKRMERFLERAATAGQLEIADPYAAALDFHALCIGELSRKLQLGVIERLSEAEIRENVERGMRTFLRAYRRSGACEQAPPCLP